MIGNKFKKNTQLLLIVVLILLGAFVVRFYKFPQRIIYGPEQARSLLTASRNLTDKFSLLGQEYFRYDSNGHQLYYSSLFTYSLIPLELLFKYDPVAITAYFALLNIFTGFIVYLVIKVFNKNAAIFAMVLFLFNSEMIYHSLFVWQYNYLPLLGVLSLLLMYLYRKNPKMNYILGLGLISGIGFGLQYLYAVYVLIIVIFILFYSKRRLLSLSLFSLGFLIGDFPMVIFDLRNNFYHIKTLFQYFLDTLKGQSDASFNYYYLLPLWPIGTGLAGILLNRFFIKRKFIAIVMTLLYIAGNLFLGRIDFNKSLGMSKNLTWEDINKAAKIISSDNPGSFNVVTLLDFDTRAYILRYPLESIYKLKPMGVVDYPNAQTVYALSKLNYNYKNPEVWELQVFYPYQVDLLDKISNSYGVFKLVKK